MSEFRQLSGWAKPGVLVVLLGFVMSLSAAAVLGLQHYSSEQSILAMETAEAEVIVYTLSSAGWRAALGNIKPRVAMDAVERTEADASVLNLQSALLRYRAEIAEGNEIPARNEVLAFGASTTQILGLVVAGRGVDALAVATESNPGFYTLQSELGEKTTAFAARALNARRLTAFATLLVYAGTAMIIGALYWRYRSARRQADHATAQQEALRLSESRFRPLVQSSSDLIALVDEQNIVTYVSPAVRKIAGLEPEQIVGKAVALLAPEAQRPALLAFVDSVKGRPDYVGNNELRFDGVDGPRYIDIVCSNRLTDPDVKGLVLNVREVTERRKLEDQLRHQAFHDSLTGLANVLLFHERLDHALTRARRSKHQKVGLVYMDIDFFKSVNDEFGHRTGDQLLQAVAQRLNESIRSIDTAARLGGDEFGILLELDDVLGEDDVRLTADRILSSISQPFELGDRLLHVSASIGVVVADPVTMSAEDVLRSADLAMYDAKQTGRDRVQFYEPGMQLSVVERLRLTTDLTSAIEQGEVIVFYQPTIDLETERIIGFEALARWDHPTKGMLSPADFIPIAEDTGAIHALGHRVLNEACRQAKAWQDEYPSIGEITMSVNVSAKQIQRPGLVEIVEHALSESGLDAHRLILEVTESVLVTHPERVIETLQQLKALGVSIALDDFGTGYSSLSYLKRFPIDVLKIDRSFIDTLDQGDRDKLLVQTIIDLGHTMQLDIVAEGIERPEQMARLRSMNCEHGQGFLFARPLDALSAGKSLAEQDRRAPRPLTERKTDTAA